MDRDRPRRPIYDVFRRRPDEQPLAFVLQIDRVEQMLLDYLHRRDQAIQPPEVDFYLIANTLEMLARERILEHIRLHPDHGEEDFERQAVVMRIRLETFRDWGEYEMAFLIEHDPLEYHRRFRLGHQSLLGLEPPT